MKFMRDLKDRFLSRGDGPLPGFVLSAYGKLPIYKDYIQWECRMGGAAQFRQWLDEAFGIRWPEFEDKNAPVRAPMRGLLLLPNGRHAVVASIWPSSDEGGLRRFPFALFGAFGRGSVVGRGVHGALAAAEPLWRCFDREFEALGACGDISAVYSYLQKSGSEVCEGLDLNGAAQVLDVSQWFESLDPEDPVGYRLQVERNLRQMLAAYRGYPEQGESLAVRLPLCSRYSLGLQVEAWARAISENLEKCPVFPSMVIEPPAVQRPGGSVCLVWREIKPEDARLFAPDPGAYDFIEDPVPSASAQPDRAAETVEAVEDLEQWLARLKPEPS